MSVSDINMEGNDISAQGAKAGLAKGFGVDAFQA